MDLLSEIAHAVRNILVEDINPKFGVDVEVVDVEERMDAYHVLLAFGDECYDARETISQIRAFVEIYVRTDFDVDCVCEDVDY